MQMPDSKFEDEEAALAEVNKVMRVANISRSGSLEYSEWFISSADKTV
jgi:hypothetical protein